MQITIWLGRTGIAYTPRTLVENNYVRPQVFPFPHANSAGNICPTPSCSVVLLNLEHNGVKRGVCNSLQNKKYRLFNINLFFLVGCKLSTGKCSAGLHGLDEKFSIGL